MDFIKSLIITMGVIGVISAANIDKGNLLKNIVSHSYKGTDAAPSTEAIAEDMVDIFTNLMQKFMWGEPNDSSMLKDFVQSLSQTFNDANTNQILAKLKEHGIDIEKFVNSFLPQ